MAVVELTMDNFEQEVLQAEGRVLVDFWAAWCGPCRMLSPLVDEVAEEHPEFKVCKVDCNEQMDLAERYNIMNIPALLVFENGELIKKNIGAIPKDAILTLVKG